MATTGDGDTLTLEALDGLATRKDVEALPTRKELVKLTEKLVERDELAKLATHKALETLARQADVQALAVQTDDAREQLIEEVKQMARTAEGHFQQLWAFLSTPPSDAALPLLQEVIAVLRPAQPARPWWARVRWPAGLVVAGLVLGGASAWGWLRPAAEVTRWAQVGWTVDKVLVDQYAGLTKPAQEAVQALYRQLGLDAACRTQGEALVGKYLAMVGLGLAVLVTSASAVMTVYSWRTGAHLVRNVGHSVPPGLYLCHPVPAEGLLPLGALVEVDPPSAVRASVAPYLAPEAQQWFWLKHVATDQGDTVCLAGDRVTVAGELVARRPLYQRYPLPAVDGCWTLGEDEVFVVGTHPQSFDARYTGPWPRAAVHGICQALWIGEE